MMKEMPADRPEEVVFEPRDPMWDDTEEVTLPPHPVSERILTELRREIEAATSKEMILFLTGAIGDAKRRGR